ncbi:MAG: protoporphyrinogen oxidase [Archangium sp.]|nr:protoporphyrinogen oxidase [Archangium sp.]MDP3569855.1 protoporphyrinogen oxidase [Archangium sp.]
MAEHLDVLVVGGGLAGITAALELQRLGRRVLLVERAAQLGGKAGSTETSLGSFPTGPTSFNGRHPAFWRLLELLGLTEDATRLRPASASRFIVRGGKLRGLRPSPLSVLSTGALTLGDKWSLAKEFMWPSPARADLSDESLESLLVRRFGQKTVDHFLAAVMTGIFAGDLRALSAQACMPALVTAEKEYGSVIKGALKAMKTSEPGARAGLYTFSKGFGVVGERAAQRLSCSMETELDSLSFTPEGVTVTGRRKNEPVEFHAARVVIATEADVAARLLGRALPAAARVLSEFTYAPVTLLQWAEQVPGDSRLPPGFGYLAAPVEELFALGTLFVGDLLEESPRRFSTFIGGALNPSRAALSDGELLAGFRGDLNRLTGGSVGQVMQVVRWPRAVFQPTVGHAGQVARLRSSLAGQPVALAGSYFGGAAMKDAIISGFAAAEGLSALSPTLSFAGESEVVGQVESLVSA